MDEAAERKVWSMLHGQGGSLMLIGELAKRTGVSRDTLRFYGRLGLLAGASGRASSNNYRRYDEAMVERVLLVRQAKLLGFTLKEIARLVADWESGKLSDEERVRIFTDKIALVDRRIAELRQVRGYLGAKLRMLHAREV